MILNYLKIKLFGTFCFTLKEKLLCKINKQNYFYNENNVPPAQLQKTPLNRKGILAAGPIC